ncbi:MAG: histidine kinase [Bacteroidales bacterium]|nr:histidine kinase [Bacteroidales bacterium]
MRFSKKILFLIVNLALLSTSYCQINIDSGLVAFYPFNGNTDDYSKNRNHGVVNGATLTTDRFGNPNSAYYFNGKSNIIIKNIPQIAFNNQNCFTVCLWIKTNCLSEGDILYKQNYGIWNGYFLRINNKDKGYSTLPGHLSFYTASGAKEDAYSNDALNNNNWIFIVGTFNGIMNISTLYINGIKQIHIGKRSGKILNKEDLMIGSNSLYLNFFNGKVDDIRIYNRILGEDEIKFLYFTKTISIPYWETSWYKVLQIAGIVIIISGIVSGIFLIIIYRIKKRNELDRKLNNFMFQALSKQMNPHFIFNSLNSVNNFILKNEKLESSRYLTKFASLMRSVLKNSQHQLIPINDEITALKLYIELESLRFDNSFNFTLNIDEKINIDENEIPPLLIQPYIENSILHGLIPKEGEKKLSLNFEKKIIKNKEYILCSIEDNGIGRKKSNMIKLKKETKHQSYGTAINKQRMEVLSTIKKMNIEIKYIDIEDSYGNAIGTRVELLIPVVL